MVWPCPVELHNLPYYWRKLSLKDAKEILSNQPEEIRTGCYLLRDSINGGIVLSRYDQRDKVLIDREITQCSCIQSNSRFGIAKTIPEYIQR